MYKVNELLRIGIPHNHLSLRSVEINFMEPLTRDNDFFINKNANHFKQAGMSNIYIYYQLKRIDKKSTRINKKNWGM